MCTRRKKPVCVVSTHQKSKQSDTRTQKYMHSLSKQPIHTMTCAVTAIPYRRHIIAAYLAQFSSSAKSRKGQTKRCSARERNLNNELARRRRKNSHEYTTRVLFFFTALLMKPKSPLLALLRCVCRLVEGAGLVEHIPRVRRGGVRGERG